MGCKHRWDAKVAKAEMPAVVVRVCPECGAIQILMVWDNTVRIKMLTGQRRVVYRRRDRAWLARQGIAVGDGD